MRTWWGNQKPDSMVRPRLKGGRSLLDERNAFKLAGHSLFWLLFKTGIYGWERLWLLFWWCEICRKNEETRPQASAGVTSEMKFPANPVQHLDESNSISSAEFGWSSSEQRTNYNGVAGHVIDDIIYHIRLHNHGFAVEMKLQHTNVCNNDEDFWCLRDPISCCLHTVAIISSIASSIRLISL